ncbi:hypothetical protein IMZ68_04080 [Candidatus Bathyarchaeota archaeon]|nr:hypothetical protein [Candidatus Bathyarchaeota archaeon]
MTLDQKELVNSLKVEWKRLWVERMDDKVRAEGIAINDYSALFVDKGTVIHATRDFKALNFREILEKHQVDNAERYIPPSPSVGGWGKFVKNNITTNEQSRNKRAQAYRIEEKKVKQQPKKCGRGWLHK